MRAGTLAIVTAGIVAAAGGLVGAGGSSARATAPQWQTVPVDKYGIQFAFWAAGRLWVGNWGGNGAARLVSGRVVKGRLTSWVTAKVSLGSFVSTSNSVLGDYLVYSNTGSGGPPEVKAVRLLPTGKVSALSDLGGAPASQSSGATQMAQLPDRVVRRAAINVGGRQHEAGCCDINGKLVDWNSFLPYNAPALANFGVDRHGRLWLAWYRVRKPVATMVELDPATLQPRGKPATAPGPTYKIDEMVCAERCRLVIEGNWGNRKPGANHFWSWAPGERSVTPIKLPSYVPNQFPQLRGAHDYRGHLLVAFETPDKQGGTMIGLARGDVRGRGMRVVRSIAVPFTIGPRDNPTGTYIGTWGPGSGWGPGAPFGPNDLAVVAEYEANKGGVRVAILPL